MPHLNIEHRSTFALQQCISLLTSAPILALPDDQKPYILFTDASNIAIGAVLAQPLAEDLSVICVIEYGSRLMEPAETRYSAYEKEFLAVIYFTHIYRRYLIGKRFYIYTDHQALKYILSNPDPHHRVARWLLKLQDYDFDIIYRPGKANANADSLSRIHTRTIGTITLGTNDNTDGILEGFSDVIYDALLSYLTSLTLPTTITDTEKRILKRISNKVQSYQGVSLLKKPTKEYETLCAIPRRNQTPTILERFHDHWTAGHQGVSLTFLKIAPQFHWPNYYTTVKNHVLSCETYQHFGSKPTRVPLNPLSVPSGIVKVIMIDYMAMPLTPSGDNCILVGIDLLSHWVHLHAFPSEDVDGYSDDDF
jgi:hypothetical protein